MIRRMLIVIFLLIMFNSKVFAQEFTAEEFYFEQYKTSGAQELDEYIPENTKDFLAQNGFDPSSSSWINSINYENVFSHIWDFIKTGAKTPLTAAAGVVSIILISAALESMGLKGGASTATLYATTLSAAAVVIAPSLSVIKACVNAMQGCAVFMMAFIPIFAVIVASAGATVTSASMSALLLGAAQAVSYISNFIVIPLLGGYMAISISSTVSPIISNSGIAEGIKKISYWIMALITTVFIGILSIQTAVNASADSLSLKTAKFIIGSAVPVAGTALSEALTTVTASMGLLKSSIGIYGVIVCCAIFLPLLAELFIWRIALVLISSVSDLFSLNKISGLLRGVDTVMSVLMGIILLTCALFVISLSVVVTVGKTQ